VCTTDLPHYYQRHKNAKDLFGTNFLSLKGETTRHAAPHVTIWSTQQKYLYLTKHKYVTLDIDIIKTSNNIKFGAAETISN